MGVCVVVSPLLTPVCKRGGAICDIKLQLIHGAYRILRAGSHIGLKMESTRLNREA